jgi:hypothetical protein
MSGSYLKLCPHGVTGVCVGSVDVISMYNVVLMYDGISMMYNVVVFYYQQVVQPLPLHVKSLQADIPVEYGDVLTAK